MVCSHECACGSVDRENVADLQAYAHLARYVAVRYPAFANEAVALLCDIFRLREAVVESLEVVGRVSVKDASGIDIRRNCIEVLLVTDPCKMTWNPVVRSNAAHLAGVAVARWRDDTALSRRCASFCRG